MLAPEETRTGIDADLAPAAHITGRVTSDGTTGIANVTVTAGPFDVGMDKYQDIAWAQTDAEGYYDLSGLPAGTFRVQFWDNAGNYLSEHYDDTRNWSEATGVAVSVGGTTPDIDAVLAPASHITGTVTDGTDPIPNIRIAVYTFEDDGQGGGWWNERGEWQAWTDAEGHYDLGGLEPGTYRLGFRDDSGTWATEFWNDAIASGWAADIVLGPGETATGKDADLAPAAHITGRVTSDGTTPIANVTVAAGPFDMGTGMYEHIAWTNTDAEGYYDLSGLPAGTFRVQFWDDKGTYLSECYDDVRDWNQATDITLAAGGERTGIDAVLAPASHITGTVTDGTDPIPNIRIAVYTFEDDGQGGGGWNERGEWQAWTDAEGHYDLGGLEPGTYRLGFRDDAGTWATEVWNNQLSPMLGDDIVLGEADSFEANAVLAPAAHITGRVTSDGSTGIANVTVAAGPFDVGTGMYEHIAWTNTDAEGYYDLSGLPAGTFRVQFWDDAGTYLSECYDDVRDWNQATDITLAAGEERTDIDAVLAPASHITGTVTDGADPIPNIRIAVYTFEDDGQGGGGWNERGEWQAWTDAEGHYDLGGLEPGTYRLGFRDDSGTWATEVWNNQLSPMLGDDIVLGEADSFEANAVLAPAAHITGRVTSDGSTGIANVTVAAGPFDVGTGMYEHIAWTNTDAEGYYDLSGLPAGTFRVQFWTTRATTSGSTTTMSATGIRRPTSR